MRREEIEACTIFWIEPADEKQAVFQQMELCRGQGKSLVVVLPNEPTSVFQSPWDFHEFKMLKRAWDLQIVFVIPRQGQAQWARSNHFAVTSSLETVDKNAPGKAGWAQVSTSQLEAGAAANGTSSLRSSAALAQLLEGEEPQTDPLAAPRLPRNTVVWPRWVPARRPSSQQLHPAPPTPPPGWQQEKRRLPWLLLVLALVLLGAVVSTGLVFAQRAAQARLTSPAPAPAATLAGHLYFLSSGQMDELGTSGINDVVTLTLSHLAPAAAGKSYYAWLRGDLHRSDAADIFLGRLQVSAGQSQLTYSDPHHANLLRSMSQVLVTEEDAGVEPVIPSPDSSTWRYLGLIPQTPAPLDTQNHFSYLDHLRHLLAADPTLEGLGLHGGLVFWLEKNTQKVSEWATAAQDERDAGLIHRHLLRILDYLDGIAQVGQDVPAGSPILVDATQGQVGLLQLHAGQTPASYLHHIGVHLSSLIVSPGASAEQRRLAQQLVVAMDGINACFAQARQDAQQLVMLSPEQLLQAPAHTLLNDLAMETNAAYVGASNPATGSVLHGVDWVQTAIQSLGVIAISGYQS